MIIGVTGLIGSGKSTAARMLGDMGAAHIDADKIAHEVVVDHPALLKKLVRRFGRAILTESGRLSRPRMAEAAFADDNSRRELNEITHPYIVREIRRQIKQLSRRCEHVIVDAALLLGSVIEKEMDCILVVHAGQKTRLQRLQVRGMTRPDALRRMRGQLPLAEFRRRADRLILNNGSPAALRNKLAAFLKKIPL